MNLSNSEFKSHNNYSHCACAELFSVYLGVMKISHLNSLYRNSRRISKFILSLLNKFEVALQFDKENLILPSLLPTDKNLKPEMMKEVCNSVDMEIIS